MQIVKQSFEELLKKSENGKLRRGCISHIATRVSASPKTIRRIWQQGKASQLENFVADVNCKFSKCVGRKQIQIDFNEVSKIPFRRHTNI